MLTNCSSHDGWFLERALRTLSILANIELQYVSAFPVLVTMRLVLTRTWTI